MWKLINSDKQKVINNSKRITFTPSLKVKTSRVLWLENACTHTDREFLTHRAVGCPYMVVDLMSPFISVKPRLFDINIIPAERAHVAISKCMRNHRNLFNNKSKCHDLSCSFL